MFSYLYKKGIHRTNNFLSQKLVHRNFELKTDKPIITFTFDDFPQSAAQKALDLLTRYDFKATYFISFGLIDQDTATGKICTIKDIENIIQSGSDLGCHTFNHMGAYEQTFQPLKTQ